MGEEDILECRIQFINDCDPFECTNFPEPTRPPTFKFAKDVPLSQQIRQIHALLNPPIQVCSAIELLLTFTEDCRIE